LKIKRGKMGVGEVVRNLETSNLERYLENQNQGYSPESGQRSLFSRYYTKDVPEGKTVYDLFEYELRTAQIENDKGEIIFKQENVEIPKGWSDTATKIVASKYFRRRDVPESRGGTKGGSEQSVKHLVQRVAHTIRDFGEKRSYFTSKEEAEVFEDELTYILLSQRAAFNSPVWFNVGLFHSYGIFEKVDEPSYYWNHETNNIEETYDSYSHPQASACFINSLEDRLLGPKGIYDLAKTEGKLFKYGSGSGTNWSKVRGKKESLSGGGESSGTVSFMGIMDAGAAAVKSGGKTRRAAKMVILNVDHPDVEEFIYWKVQGERKARALAATGYDMSDIDALYREIDGQNSNNSIRVTDEFMKAVEEDREWHLIGRKSGQVVKTLRARELFEYMAKAAWVSGDPGIQFDTTINKWHTCANTAPINASNPCSEYMFLDDSACNLASLNLMKFLKSDGSFDIEGFKHSSSIMITAQEILVDLAGYPTYDIAKNSHDYRPLGLGYANLGALLMSRGMAYDSDEGRATAAAITSLMTGEAYRQSAKIASRIGPYPGFEKNREPHLRVMRQHYEHHQKISTKSSKINLEEILLEGDKVWRETIELQEKHGARNAQATVLAPTGTIGFMMDCDTTGIEPDIALVKYKKMIGGGVMKLVNNTVPAALANLKYDEEQIKDIIRYIQEKDTIEGAPHLKEEHLPIFDCALKPANGKRAISPMGHVRMMAAVQPFISGAISKTVNTPEDWTARDIYNIYLESWRLGLKAIAVYRDGSKLAQPLSIGKSQLESKLKRGEERPLPQNTESMTIRIKIKDEHGIEQGLHIICGEYEDGTLGEVRAQLFEAGSAIQGLLDDLTRSWSKELRFGVPIEELVVRNRKSKFPPSGTSNYPYMINFNSLSHLIWGIIGLEYLGNEKFADITGEESFRTRIKNPEKLRVNKNRERLRFETYMEQIKEIDRVMNTPLFGKRDKVNSLDNENGNLREVQIVNENGLRVEYTTERKKISNGQTCPACGFPLPGLVGCTHCTNCGKQVGGGCPS